MTEEEKIQELLKPRYKVIADYPENPIPVGEVLSDIKNDTLRKYYKDLWKDVVKKLDKYPHLFKRLEWWEDRKPEEMPEYVRYSDWYLTHYHLGHEFKEKVFRVIKVDTGNYGIRIYIADDDRKYVESFLPATSSEYQQYINSKPQL